MITSTTTTPKLLLKPREAAASLAVSEKTLWTWTKAGRIPCVRLGASVRYSVAQLEAWIAGELSKENSKCQ